jgi:hypothetical protein
MARDAQLSGDRVQSEYYLSSPTIISAFSARTAPASRISAASATMIPTRTRARICSKRPATRIRKRTKTSRAASALTVPSAAIAGDRERRYSREERARDQDDDRNGIERGNGADEERIAMDVLPPPIRRDEDGGEQSSEEVEARPKRRARRPRAEDSEGEVAPAA